MAASGKNLLENKIEVGDVMPPENWRLPDPLVNIVMEYAMDVPFLKPCFFSGSDHALLKTLFLAEHAGPLDKFEFFARSLITKELKNKSKTNVLVDRTFIMDSMQGTLIQLLVSRLDVTIRDAKGNELAKGMTENFIEIIEELLPHRLEEVYKQAKQAIYVEDSEAQSKRENSNYEKLFRVFEAFKQEDEKAIEPAINKFKEFIESKKPSQISGKINSINNLYYMDQLHLIYAAFGVLGDQSDQLPRLNPEGLDWWYEKKADLFCYAIIGGVLEINLPPRLRQILTNNLRALLNNIKSDFGLINFVGDRDKTLTRFIDPNGKNFKGIGTERLLGDNTYYDIAGQCGEGYAWQGCTNLDIFENFMTSLNLSFNKIYNAAYLMTERSHQLKETPKR